MKYTVFCQWEQKVVVFSLVFPNKMEIIEKYINNEDICMINEEY